MAPDILTDRVRINDLTLGDAQALFAYRSDREVARYQSWSPASINEVRAFIARNTSTPFNQDDSWYQLAVRCANTDELLGDIGVHFVASEGRQAELGFTIAPLHQRKGLGTLAVTAVLDHLFTTLKKHRVTASVDPRNKQSLALLRRVGMRQEAHFRQSLLLKGEWVDDVVFGLLGSDWRPSSLLPPT